MASAKQIAANRRNAQRSTGPRTAAGKSVSSRNALRHGLSLPLTMDAMTMAAIDELTGLIKDGQQQKSPNLVATEAASALLDLAQIRKVRNTLLASIDLTKATLEELQQLVALDRYERRARTRRRRAAARLGKET